jgi:hypothetical protein
MTDRLQISKQLVINFEEITEVEKKLTAKIIPNGITISTSTSKVSA